MNQKPEIGAYDFPRKVKHEITKEIYARYGSLAAYYRKHLDKFPNYPTLHAVLTGRMHHPEIEEQLKRDVLWHLIIWRTKNK